MRITGRFCRRNIAAAAAVLLSAAVFAAPAMASESGYYDEYGNWVEDAGADLAEQSGGQAFDGGPAADDAQAVSSDGVSMGEAADALLTDQAAAPTTGTWTMGDGWSIDDSAGTQSAPVYKKSDCIGLTDTSTITCSYVDTNYSVLEYEQLRDMLTNNLLYSNVNAQISASAVYTESKDYLYILIVDDTAQLYRDIYHYVVGDYRCFLVQVREYRSEADAATAAGTQTPQEVGQKAAESFVWNM